ncbi:hypothetical protein [Vulcanisaeta distributa]|uniref:hypothetical protein n=1 Tax=Vulcanisaeta distributa TaxID=164451 RepID=UPI0006D1C627|nr:hypothetical protein [Vulcanisaeta distributa]
MHHEPVVRLTSQVDEFIDNGGLRILRVLRRFRVYLGVIHMVETKGEAVNPLDLPPWVGLLSLTPGKAQRNIYNELDVVINKMMH